MSVRALRRLAALTVPVVAAAAFGLTGTAWAGGNDGPINGGNPDPGSGSNPGGGSISAVAYWHIRVTTNHTTSGTGGTSSYVDYTPPVCYYFEGETGPELYDFFASGKAAYLAYHTGESITKPAGTDDHKADGPDKGMWWFPECDEANWPDPSDNGDHFLAYVDGWFNTHPDAIWVPVGTPPPPPHIDHQVLVNAAYDAVTKHLDSPVPDRNPAGHGYVNLPTFLWQTAGQQVVTATASVVGDGGEGLDTATTTGVATKTKFTSNGADTVTCTTAGMAPYKPGVSDANQPDQCSITFNESSKHGNDSKDGVPEWVVNVATEWEVHDGGINGPLIRAAVDGAGSQFSMPVDEVQSVGTQP